VNGRYGEFAKEILLSHQREIAFSLVKIVSFALAEKNKL
jgi:hypothetical protein